MSFVDFEDQHDLIYEEDFCYYATTTSNPTPSMCYIAPCYVSSLHGPVDDSYTQYLVPPFHVACDTVDHSYRYNTPQYVPSMADRTLAVPSQTFAYSGDFPPPHIGCEMMTASTHGNHHQGMSSVSRKKKGKAKKPSMSSEITVKSYTSRLGIGNAKGDITIRTDEFNRDDFQVVYNKAKFFVIRPINLADVHKSVKYGVWSTSSTGNEKLDSAFREAQAIAASSCTLCPVLLFYSVNGSSDFCGVAEMVGPVNIQKDMDFWSKDRWIGSFPVKWHIIKDICNPTLRSIILQNNEDKPITSNDPQEIDYNSGIAMLKIFKDTRAKKCLLDNFLMHEDKEAKDLENNMMFKLRRGAQHFVCAGPACSTPQPKSDRLIYRAVRERKNLKDELQVLDLDGHRGGEIHSETPCVSAETPEDYANKDKHASAAPDMTHEVQKVPVESCPPVVNSLSQDPQPNHLSGFIYVGCMPIPIG